MTESGIRKKLARQGYKLKKGKMLMVWMAIALLVVIMSL